MEPAIHDIFTANANKFPDRECVIETKSRQRPQRTFTYRQINESSNQLARYFLDHGCEVGDVVTIYAYRGFVSVLSFPAEAVSIANGDTGWTLSWHTWERSRLVQL
jgi:acyl-CoA synthetase (AMP-forming)/AMP-acid ligase II